MIRNHTDQVHTETMREKNEKKTATLPCNTEVHPSITHIGQLPRYAAKPVLPKSGGVSCSRQPSFTTRETTTWQLEKPQLSSSKTTTWQLREQQLAVSKTYNLQLRKPQLDSFKNHSLTSSKTTTSQIEKPQLDSLENHNLTVFKNHNLTA